MTIDDVIIIALLVLNCIFIAVSLIVMGNLLAYVVLG
jgi:hypothetical protein